MSLEETKTRLLAASKTSEELLSQVNALYIEEIRSEKKILKNALSQLHNAGEIDLVELVGVVSENGK